MAKKLTNESRSREDNRNSLPESQRATFDALVSDYQESASEHSKGPWVNYRILADLVRAGWQKLNPSN